MCLSVASTYQLSRTSNQGTQKPKHLGSGNSFIYPVRRGTNRRIQWWNYFSNPTKHGGDIAIKLGARADTGKRKALVMRDNSQIYTKELDDLDGKVINVWVAISAVVNNSGSF